MSYSGDNLGDIVEGCKKSLSSKDSDYVTVFITVLVGEEDDVMEAEEIVRDLDQDDLACKSARITLSGWLG